MNVDPILSPALPSIASRGDPQRRSLTLLNELGDITIEWTAETDEKMQRLIQSLMDQGVTFFKLRQGLIRTRRTKIKSLDELKEFTVTTGDENFEKLFFNGEIEMRRRAPGNIETVGVLKTAAAVAQSRSTVATRAFHGG